jgi:hypothetical protein
MTPARTRANATARGGSGWNASLFSRERGVQHGCRPCKKVRLAYQRPHSGGRRVALQFEDTIRSGTSVRLARNDRHSTSSSSVVRSPVRQQERFQSLKGREDPLRAVDLHNPVSPTETARANALTTAAERRLRKAKSTDVVYDALVRFDVRNRSSGSAPRKTSSKRSNGAKPLSPPDQINDGAVAS